MSSIRSIVRDTLSAEGRSQYLSYGEGVITALEDREESIKDGLLSYAGSRGLGDAEVRNLFIQVGLEEAPEPEPIESVTNLEGDLAAVLSRIEGRLASLERAAQRHGVSV